MKRRFSLFALLLALLLALSACSGQPSPQPQQPLTTLQELQELLTRDYIVGYLWYCDGLPEQGELTEDEYLPVDPAGGYATLADLQQLVEKTYTPACVSALLQNADTLGRPRFVEREGRLYKSSRPVFSRYYWDYDAESVTITEETAENLTFTVTMQNLHTGEMLPLTRTAQKTAEGWRLAEVGIPAAEADLTTAAAEETRAIAEKFVAALVENNIETIAACAGEAPETYQNWRGMSIPTAEITETLEEYDGCGRYRVHMAVENAFGVFAKGEEDYLLIVQQEQGQESPVICYYEPMEKIAYNYSEDRDDPACEMALLFLQAEGGMRFNGSFWLDRATATDFALTMLYAENEGKTAFAAEEVTAAAQKYMGLYAVLQNRGCGADHRHKLRCDLAAQLAEHPGGKIHRRYKGKVAVEQRRKGSCIFPGKPGAYPRHPGADVTGGGHSQHCGCAAAHLHHLVMGDAQILGAGGADGGGAAADGGQRLGSALCQLFRLVVKACEHRVHTGAGHTVQRLVIGEKMIQIITVALGTGDTACAGVGLLQQTQLGQRGHLVAQRGTGNCHIKVVCQHTAAHGLALEAIQRNDRLQDSLLACIHRHSACLLRSLFVL